MDFCGILSLKGEHMPRKRNEIKLTADEQHVLETYVSQGHKPAREINRARILLLSNDGMKGKEIAKVLGVSQTTIANRRQKFHQKEHQDILNFLKDEPRSGRPIKLDRKVAAHTTMIACSTPPEGSVRWTRHLIADKLVQLNVVNTISHESVRSILKKVNSNLGSVNNGGLVKLRVITCGIWKTSFISRVHPD